MTFIPSVSGSRAIPCIEGYSQGNQNYSSLTTNTCLPLPVFVSKYPYLSNWSWRRYITTLQEKTGGVGFCWGVWALMVSSRHLAAGVNTCVYFLICSHNSFDIRTLMYILFYSIQVGGLSSVPSGVTIIWRNSRDGCAWLHDTVSIILLGWNVIWM